MAENTAKSTPARVLLLFTLLLAGMAAARWQDRTPTTISYPTALEDTQLVPSTLRHFRALLDGQSTAQSFTITSRAPVTKADHHLFKCGQAEHGAFTIYQDQQAYWLKTAPGQYLRATVAQ